MDGKRVIIIATWVLIVLSSLGFERIHEDEAVFMGESKRVSTSGPFTHGALVSITQVFGAAATRPLDIFYASSIMVFIPQVLGAAATAIYDSLLSARVASALAVLMTAIFIYGIGKDDTGFIGSMLYLTSFYTVRFGLRFYLDPYGGLFAVAAVYLMYQGRGISVGIASAAALFSRQLAAPLFPVFAFLTYRRKLGLMRFVFGAFLVAAIPLLWLFFSGVTQQERMINPSEFSSITYHGASLLPSIARGWLQYALISPLITLGLILSKGARSRIEFYPILASFVSTSLAPGFVINGAATQYPYILNTLACVPSGFGLVKAYCVLKRNRKVIVRTVVVVLTLQFLAQSYFATTLSVDGTIGLQDYGYWHDQELLSYLRRNYDGGKIYSSTSIVSLEESFSEKWRWIQRDINQALEDDPPWLVTYLSYVVIGPAPPNVTVTAFGPYVVIHNPGSSLSSFIRPSNVSKWILG